MPLLEQTRTPPSPGKLRRAISLALSAGLHGGMLFEELNFRYIGPVDGHNIRQLQKYLGMARQMKGPVLLHVVVVQARRVDGIGAELVRIAAGIDLEEHGKAAAQFAGPAIMISFVITGPTTDYGNTTFAGVTTPS